MDAQQQLVNSFDCPLLLRTNVIHLVPAACLKHAVSVVHQCDSRCGWMEKDQPTQVERELSDISPKIIHMPIIVFVHVSVINDFWRLRTLSAWRKERLGSTRIARGIVPNKRYTTWSFEPGIN